MRHVTLWMMVAAAFVASAAQAQTIEEVQPPDMGIDEKAIFSVDFENDIFGGTDSGYTNGVRFAVSSSEAGTPASVRWMANHLLPVSSDGKKRISFALGQNMYVPTDITTRTPDPSDRPYAGWLYGSVGVVSDRGDRLDNVMLTVGVVGPSSFADRTQDYVHRVIDYQRPYGWDSQLKDEPGVVLTWERTWRSLYQMQSMQGIGLDVSPHIGANLGNINTDASAGATVRLGFDLPADYGPPRIRPSLPGSDFFTPTQDLGGYLFAGVQGRAVGRNIFLDGNTFTDSPSVDKKYFVGSLQAGATLTWGDNRLSYTHVFMSKEFETQKKAEQFGALTYSYRF